MALKYLLLKVSPLKVLHYAITLCLAAAIVFTYYAFLQALPYSLRHTSQLNWFWNIFTFDWFWDVFMFEFFHYVIGILLNIPILYAILTLGWKRSIPIIVALLICITPYILSFSFHGDSPAFSYVVLIIPGAIVISTKMLMEYRERGKKILAEKERLRIILMREKIKANEGERKRFAQELHDGVIQSLLLNASIARELSLSHSNKTSSDIEKELNLIETHSMNTASEIRNICHDLMPSILYNLGLLPSIRWLADRLYRETGIIVNISVEGSAYELEQNENINLFRLVQETLNNIKQHSAATRVNISIEFQDKGISIVIKDNGKGFDLPENIYNLASVKSLGIINMYERAQSIGANFSIHSQIGSGTLTIIKLNVNRSSQFAPDSGTTIEL